MLPLSHRQSIPGRHTWQKDTLLLYSTQDSQRLLLQRRSSRLTSRGRDRPGDTGHEVLVVDAGLQVVQRLLDDALYHHAAYFGDLPVVVDDDDLVEALGESFRVWVIEEILRRRRCRGPLLRPDEMRRRGPCPQSLLQVVCVFSERIGKG